MVQSRHASILLDTRGLISFCDSLAGEEVSIAGRIHTMRASGEKLRFYDLYADGQRIQILANAKCVSSFSGLLERDADNTLHSQGRKEPR